MTAPEILCALEYRGIRVTLRTIYRDLLALQGSGLPIECFEEPGYGSRWNLKFSEYDRHVAEITKEPYMQQFINLNHLLVIITACLNDKLIEMKFDQKSLLGQETIRVTPKNLIILEGLLNVVARTTASKEIILPLGNGLKTVRLLNLNEKD